LPLVAKGPTLFKRADIDWRTGIANTTTKFVERGVCVTSAV